MCDLSNEQRRAAYKELRKIYLPGFARRARDFNLTTLLKKHKVEIK